jgi:Lon protease-like protein
MMADEQTPTKTHEEWVREAFQILLKQEGDGRLLRVVQFEHLQAIAKEQAVAVANVGTLTRVIAALMSHAGTDELPVRGATLRAVMAKMPNIQVVTQNLDGDVVVALKYMRPMTAPESGRVQ